MFSTSTPIIPTIALLISLIIIFLFAPSFLPINTHHKSPPIPLADEQDDLALFTRATRRATAKSRLGSTNQNPKIAFLFLTNTDLYFSPLWELFFKNHSSLYNIYIHADPTVKITPPTGVFQGRVIGNLHRTYRGTATLISAARRLIATAILDDSSNFYFALISQQCIPLHSFKFVYNALFSIDSDSTALDKISFIEILSNQSILWDRYNARGKRVMVPEVPFEKFRVGSQFFILTRRHSLMVLRDQRLWRKFKIPCINVHSCYPEEHYFPTLLSMVDPKGCSFYTLTRVNWTDSVNGHPHTYYPPEVSAQLIYTLRESNSSHSYLFARKFSPDCLKPLLDLSKKVIFKD
ncbi:Core-2/I-branching beta-1,6-N-acetylglucosaminyltransferase family protein [Heracleum sosnowskyi]|uniref:Core-2/I-branching beta-1,6-N-acetylglucosaminyltransferase family protein n=1 Tax=Heracleum sosnowskyi TaxID=360622 RepID=A0AAD8J2A8_9APIA|nr:Core-2/I-branching beta-1,6-N-acetylglucosaminyltransferase family protein [Heracleum sosnowskyi]